MVINVIVASLSIVVLSMDMTHWAYTFVALLLGISLILLDMLVVCGCLDTQQQYPGRVVPMHAGQAPTSVAVSIQVTIPAGVQAGQQITFPANGTTMTAVVPSGYPPGSQLTVVVQQQHN